MPLVDVFLILLVILMIVTRIDQLTYIPIEIPSSQAAQPTVEPDRLQITIDVDSQVYIGTNPVDIEANPEALTAAVTQAILKQREVPVLIRGDHGAKHGTVVKVMGLVRAADPTGEHVQMAVVANVAE